MDPHGAVDLFYEVLGDDLEGSYHDPCSADEWLRRRAFVDGLYYALFFALKRGGWKSGVELVVDAHERASKFIAQQLQAAVYSTHPPSE